MQLGGGVCGSPCRSPYFEPLIIAYILCSIINGIGGSLLALRYFPKRGSDSGLSKKTILGQIDFVGAFLSIAGLTLLSVSRSSNLLVGKVYADANDSLAALRLQSDPAGRVRHLNGAPWVGLKYLRGPNL
jgi:hypothetical protein